MPPFLTLVILRLADAVFTIAEPLSGGAVVEAAFVGVGAAVLGVSCAGFAWSVAAFAAHGRARRRSASAMSRSMFGYAGSARFTARQRSSASL